MRYSHQQPLDGISGKLATIFTYFIHMYTYLDAQNKSGNFLPSPTKILLFKKILKLYYLISKINIIK